MEITDLEQAKEFAQADDRTRDLIVVREQEDDGEDEEENTDREFDFGEAPIGTDVADNLQELVVDSISEQIEKCRDGEKSFEEYNVSNVNKDVPPVQHLSSEEFPFTDSISDLVERRRNFADSSYEPPRPDFQAIRVKSSDGGILVAFRNYTNHQIVSQSNRSWIMMRGERYDTFENELVSLPKEVDAIYYDGVFYVFKQKSFEDIFNYTEHLKDTADEVFDTIEESDVLIHDMDGFRERSKQDRNKLRKLHEVAENGISDELTMDTAKGIIDDYDLDLEVEENDDGEEGIRIPNGRLVWTAIRLFNNDHLESPVNADRFQVYGKDKRSD